MGKVSPIPEGFGTITPHLIVKGAAKAMDFYKTAFGAEEMCRMNGPDGQSIMYGEMKIGDSRLMIAEEWPGDGMPKAPSSLGGSCVTVHLYVTDVDAAFKKAMDAGGTTTMPPMDMFWGDRYGKVKDPFGHEWSIATHIEDVPPEEMPARMADAMSKMGDCGG